MFRFGKRSKRELKGVHPDLVKVVKTALSLSKADFAVIDGLRTLEEQENLVKIGASKTMKSRHLEQEDGYGHAVDLVGFLHGKARWEWPVVYEVAEAMKKAAEYWNIDIVWGGCWHTLNERSSSVKELSKMYIKRKNKKGKKAFVDGPHFQLG